MTMIIDMSMHQFLLCLLSIDMDAGQNADEKEDEEESEEGDEGMVMEVEVIANPDLRLKSTVDILNPCATVQFVLTC